MVEREIAYRIFAKEFNDSGFQLSSDSALQEDSGSIHSPNFIVTPTGAKINRVLVVGVITEVEDMGAQKSGEKELWRARISDPTGSFTVYAGNYQPEAMVFLSNVEVPSYVMVVGKIRSYEPEDGDIFVSIRPEEINYADEYLRTRWIVDTAEMTLKRMDQLAEARDSGLSGKVLLDHLSDEGVYVHSAEGICLALEYYHTSPSYISGLKNEIKKALLSVQDDIHSESSASPDNESIILEAMVSFGKGNAVEYSELQIVAASKGISADQLDSGIRSLLIKGHIYEPRAGTFKVID